MGYNDISSYGIIGDLNTVALVGQDGSIDFMCFPRFDSPSIFAAILDDDKGGYFKVSPELPEDNKIQMYLPDTNVLLTRFLSSEGICELTDFMPVSEIDKGGLLIRSLKIVQGDITINIRCAPRFNYGRSKHKAERHGNEIIFTSYDGTVLRVKSSVPLEIKDGDIDAFVKLKTGDVLDIILFDSEHDGESFPHLTEYCHDKLFATLNFWKQWIGRSRYIGNWKDIINRSLLTLKLLTYNKNGAFIAAPTFSLPEEIGGSKNWDYRFVWIRDASFFMNNMIEAGYLKEATALMNWMQNVCEDIGNPGKLDLMCTIDGKPVYDEIELESFKGYKNSSPVRIGNGAHSQLQLDIFGELMDAVNLYDERVDFIPYGFWKNLSGQLNWLEGHWQKEDEGIWEVRGGRKQFLYSRVMCWTAFDRAIKLGERRSLPYPSSWKETRNKIFLSIYDDFWNDNIQSFVQYKGSNTVDASLLLMPILQFISPKDPMWISTLKRIEDKLVTGSLVYRYQPDEGLTGLKGSEGTFSMCTFWYIECLARSGQLQKARMVFEKMLGYSNHLGIYSEQISKKGEMLGNYPQAITHIGLISAVADLSGRLRDEVNREV